MMIRSWRSGRTLLFCVLFLFSGLMGSVPFDNALFGADPLPAIRRIEPPKDWNSQPSAGKWIRATTVDWTQFHNTLIPGSELAKPSAPVVMDAVYRATFDGAELKNGQFEWSMHRFYQAPGFVKLGRSTLAVSQLKWDTEEAIHGTTPTGDWVLWCEAQANRLTGQWTHRGTEKLDAVVFEITLPCALSSRFEIRAPEGWKARILGVIGSDSSNDNSADRDLWKFELGRQQTIQLRLERQSSAQTPRILVRENTVYGLTTTDDLIRLRSDLDCKIDGHHNADLRLATPKTLRVYNVLLGNELPLAFERELGSEEDQLRIPLRSLTPGQRVTLRILGESQRRSDRSFSVPRLRPLNAVLQSGSLRVAVDHPLEVRAVEATGLRQTNQTQEGGQEIRSYEVLSNDCRLSLQVGEPAAVLHGEILFIADVQGESPTSRVRVRLSTREGELFSPQMLIPSGWDLITVALADVAETAPAAWQVTEGPGGDSILNIELRQPVRPDRDCTLLMEFKTSALKPGAPRRLPIPRIRDAHHCFARGVIWDNSPWELDEGSTGTIELDGTAASDELIQAVGWTRTLDSQAVPTGIRIPSLDSQTKPLFRVENSTAVDLENLSSRAELLNENSLLGANLELETRTSRVGRTHPHRAMIQFSRAATPGEFRVALPAEAELTRVMADDREISFVRQEAEVILDSSARPISELVLEYRTAASPGWIVSRDEVVFPQLDCFVTEFAWHLILDSDRRLYRLPLTAAVSPREQPRPWERLLGPLARNSEETVFHPWAISDWRSLMNGTSRAGDSTSSNDVWLVAPQIPERISLKTWNVGVSHSLAWCGFLGALASGIGLRRGRNLWFRRGWIYLGGLCLVVAVFVAEPYAPIAGGAFLGCLLAIIVPRRFAIGRDWLANQRPQRPSATGRTAIVAGLLVAFHLSSLSLKGQGQEASPRPDLVYFQILEGKETVIYFDAAFRPQWDNWKEQSGGPPWLLQSSRYDVQADASGPPRMTATYQVAVFGDSSRFPLRLPLAGVSLDRVEGLVDGQPIRLIPAADRQGFVLPFQKDSSEPTPTVPPPPPQAQTGQSPQVRLRNVTLIFRPLPTAAENDQMGFSALIPSVPECTVALNSPRWQLTTNTGEFLAPSDQTQTYDLGPVDRLNLVSGLIATSPRENLVDLQLRTLIECGPLGARVQVGVLASVSNSRLPTDATIALPASLHVQSISGVSLDHYQVQYGASETLVALRLKPTAEAISPIEIFSFLPVTATGFQMTPPRWRPLSVKQRVPFPEESTVEPRTMNSYVGVVAEPGFSIIDATPRSVATPIPPQSFSDSLFSGMVWQLPDFAWNCRDSSGPVWTLNALVPKAKAQLSQLITLQAPQSDWRLEATIDTSQGLPFEHLFLIDPRIEVIRASVQQDGADRLFRWTRTGDQVRLSVRDGQPGSQSIRIEGVIEQGSGAWSPPVCEYRSGQTTESSVTVRNSARVISTLKWADSTTRLRPNSGQSDEELHYLPGTPSAPLTMQVAPLFDQRSALAWIDLVPQRDHSWQVNIRAQLKESLPLAAPIRISWDQPGLTDFRLTNRRDNVRQTTNGKAFLWRPQLQTSKPSELTISATISGDASDRQSIRLPQLSGVNWSEVWVSLPRGSGYRPARANSTLLPSAPSDWPPGWVSSLTSSREDLFACTTAEISIETSASEPLVRPVLAESLIWMDEAGDPAIAVRFGVTKYLLLAERDLTFEIPDSSRAAIRAIAIDGQLQSADSPVHVKAKANDVSHELVIWWKTAADLSAPDPWNLIHIPNSMAFPHWIGVVPPHHQVLLDHWGRRDPGIHDFWLQRSEAMLLAAKEYQGAAWSVDGPLLHDLADSREELNRFDGTTTAEQVRRAALFQKWNEFSRSGGSITSPIQHANGRLHHSGLDTILALCGESKSLWLDPDSEAKLHVGPQLLDRRWAIVITAGVASTVSLLALMWIVRIFRRLDVAERLAARPNAAMAGLGFVWWACLSPSVFGLVLGVAGGGLWLWDRLSASRNSSTSAAKNSAA